MKRISLMVLALMFFLLAPAFAQGSSASGDADRSGAAKSSGAVGDDAAADDAGGAEDQDAGAMDESEAGEVDGEEEVAGGGAADSAPWTFAAFDENGDGVLAPGEFSTGLFAFVTGDVPSLSQDRYEDVVDIFGVTDVPDFEQADVNHDTVVTDDQEFTPAIATGLFQAWDTDGNAELSSGEFSSNMFEAFDADDGGTLSSDEIATFAGWFEDGMAEVAGGGAAEGGVGEEFFLEQSNDRAPEVGEDVGAGEDDSANYNAKEDASPGDDGEQNESGDQ